MTIIASDIFLCIATVYNRCGQMSACSLLIANLNAMSKPCACLHVLRMLVVFRIDPFPSYCWSIISGAQCDDISCQIELQMLRQEATPTPSVNARLQAAACTLKAHFLACSKMLRGAYINVVVCHCLIALLWKAQT